MLTETNSMPNWHAYAAAPKLLSGTEVLITGGSQVVRVMTGDQIIIELPDTNRLLAVVVDRSAERMLVGFADGQTTRLHMVSDDGFRDFQLSEGFSRQSWAVD